MNDEPEPQEIADVYPPDARAELIRWALGHPFVEHHRQQLVLEEIDRLLGVSRVETERLPPSSHGR